MLDVLLRKKEQKKLAFFTALSNHQPITLIQLADEFGMSRPTTERQVLSLINDLETIYGYQQHYLVLNQGTLISTIDSQTTKNNPGRTLINFYLKQSKHYQLLSEVTQIRLHNTQELLIKLDTTLPYLKKVTTELNKVLAEFNLSISVHEQSTYLDGPPLNMIMFAYLLNFVLAEKEDLSHDHYLFDNYFNGFNTDNQYRVSAISQAITTFQLDLTEPLEKSNTLNTIIESFYSHHQLIDKACLPVTINPSYVPYLNFLFIQLINLDLENLPNRFENYDELLTNLTRLKHPVQQLSHDLVTDFSNTFQITWPNNLKSYIESAIIVHLLSVQTYELNIISRFFRSVKFQYGYRIESPFSSKILAYLKDYHLSNYLPADLYFPDIDKSVMFALAIAYQMRDFVPISISISISTNNMAERLIKEKLNRFIRPEVCRFSNDQDEADLIIADHFLSSLANKESMIIDDITNPNIWIDLTTKISEIYDKKNKLTNF